MCTFSVPPGYRRSAPPRRPKLGEFTGIIDQILLEDRQMPLKQRHTAKRIFERLRSKEMFVPLHLTIHQFLPTRGVGAAGR